MIGQLCGTEHDGLIDIGDLDLRPKLVQQSNRRGVLSVIDAAHSVSLGKCRRGFHIEQATGDHCICVVPEFATGLGAGLINQQGYKC
ncbi:hypothetical protein AW168_32390 [Nocardia brasiliensis]|nr:hypothetical protein AW168_32390 [Nocardia brasiliensis]